jgi:ribose-phosphate pyrophosphokinase
MYHTPVSTGVFYLPLDITISFFYVITESISMIYLNMNEQKHVTYHLFTDNQPHIQLKDISRGDDVSVITDFSDGSINIIRLLMVSNALDALGCRKRKLIIPYLIGARSDRHMTKDHSDSFDLKVMADLINSLNFEVVLVFDAHSDMTTGLIRNCFNVSNEILTQQYNTEDAVLIFPDAGAGKKAKDLLARMPTVKDVIFCSKERNLQTQDLELIVINPEICTGRNVVIVDDLCDGGRTFTSIIKQLPKSIGEATLIVGHSLFSYGTGELEKYFNRIITSDSTHRSFAANRGFLTVVPITDYLCQHEI